MDTALEPQPNECDRNQMNAGPDLPAAMHKVGNGWVDEARWQEILEIRRQNAQRRNEKPKVDQLLGPVLETEAGKSAGYRETLAWVMERVWEEECPKGATPLAASLWKAATANKAAFVSDNMPLLVRGEKTKEDGQDEDEAVDGNIQLIEEWFKDRAGVCPHCGRSGWSPGAGVALSSEATSGPSIP